MKAITIISLAGLVCLATYTYSGCRPAWQFEHLEQNARRVVTGAQLQAWANNLLARHPEPNTSLKGSELGSDFPKQLLDLAPRLGPSICVYEKDDNNYPVPCVHVYWGSGMLGARGFEIGPTNFVSIQPSHAWQPGVYFYRR